MSASRSGSHDVISEADAKLAKECPRTHALNKRMVGHPAAEACVAFLSLAYDLEHALHNVSESADSTLLRNALVGFCEAFRNRGETTSLREWNNRMQQANDNATEALAGRLPYAEPSVPASDA